MDASLTCHPRTPTDAVRAITVRVRRTAAGLLGLGFSLDADLDRLRLPAPRPVRIGRDLWQHTCFEAFVGVAGASAYHEINLSPSGEWTVLAFRRYRDGGPLADEAMAPRTTVGTRDGGLALDAEISLPALAPAYTTAPLRLGLAAVIEETDARLSYWSLHHPAGSPDFHHGDAFAVRLEPPGPAC